MASAISELPALLYSGRGFKYHQESDPADGKKLALSLIIELEQGHNVPRISFFLGIAIYMYYREHAPPHFHAEYGDFEVTIEIESGIVSGRFPRRALSLVLEWTMLRKEELLANWELASKRLPLNQIEPLE